MKAQAKKMAIPAIVAALMASLAPVPAKSTVLPGTAIEVQKREGLTSTLTFNLEGEQVFLPLAEATAYLNSLNDHKRKLLSESIEARAERGKGPLFSRSSKMISLANENISQCVRVKDAIRIVLTHENLMAHFPDLSEREFFKAELVKFGRAVALSEYIARDILSAIEQSVAPKKTYQPDNMPSADAVKAMIAAEHKNLGLSAPEFV
ncbi:iron-sulfur cluster assembly scaffold protein SufA [Budvicia diplopodorum]|uniref:iron-sulfur cluster assembly scaffold protein SufA n=1 Tax=Budvicia diplopodorum TaxID=1119056 RepID=UPI001478F3B1|nr:iron-sulfur cluster assembly scaffold protein SufA [Budvicia diplopodorum]